MSNDLSIKEYETINDLLLVSFTDSTDAVIPIKKLREMCPCASCAGETDALGNVYKELGDIKKSIELYQKAILIKPEYTEAQNNLDNAKTLK